MPLECGRDRADTEGCQQREHLHNSNLPAWNVCLQALPPVSQFSVYSPSIPWLNLFLGILFFFIKM